MLCNIFQADGTTPTSEFPLEQRIEKIPKILERYPETPFFLLYVLSFQGAIWRGISEHRFFLCIFFVVLNSLTLQPLPFWKKDKGNPEKDKGSSLRGTPKILGKGRRNAQQQNQGKSRKTCKKARNKKKTARVGLCWFSGLSYSVAGRWPLKLRGPTPGEIQKGTGGRGRDRKCHKLSWRLSQNCRDILWWTLWRFMTFYDVLKKETEIVIKCRKLSCTPLCEMFVRALKPTTSYSCASCRKMS